MLDIAVISESAPHVYVLLNQTETPDPDTFTFSAPQIFPVGNSPQAIAAIDLRNFSYRSRTLTGCALEMEFQEEPAEPTSTDPDESHDTTLLTKTRPTELIVANRDDNNLSILLARGMNRALFDPASPTEVGSSPVDLAIGQLGWEGSTGIDFFVCNEASDSLSILQGTSRNNLATRRPTEFPAHTNAPPQLIVLGNFDGNLGTVEFVIVSSDNKLAGGKGQAWLKTYSSGTTKVESNAPDIQVGIGIDIGGTGASVSPPRPLDIVATDFFATYPNDPNDPNDPNMCPNEVNISERTQIAIVLHPDHDSRILLDENLPQANSVVEIYGNSPFQKLGELPVGHGGCAIDAGDFTHTGRQSLVVANAFDHTVTLWINDSNTISDWTSMTIGSGGFQPRDVKLVQRTESSGTPKVRRDAA